MSSKVNYLSCPDLSKARLKGDGSKVVPFDMEPDHRLIEAYKGKKYFIKTYGCQGNVRDEETMAGLLEALGMERTSRPSESKISIVNTCAVRENAESKVYGEIGKFKSIKEKDKDFVLCVSGCMMQEEGKANLIVDSYPQVSIVFGTHNINSLYDLLLENLLKKERFVDVRSFPGEIVEGLPYKRLLPYKAYVDISYGCDKFCTYCIVPYTRGRERSRRMGDILAECKKLYAEGYQEVTLLGQNVNSYGKDIGEYGFSDLLEEVAKIGIPRIRFLTSHPFDFEHSMLEAIAKYPNIMPWIHLPLQSGSDDMLRRMGRRYTQKEYLSLVEDIRRTIPGVSLSTDIIVGFPNETDEDFDATLEVAKQVAYESAFTFIYSPRNGTPAARIKDNVSDKIKHERFVRLTKVIEASVEKSSDLMVGNTYDVLVDGPSKRDKEVLSGYTEGNKLVNFKGPQYLVGCIVPVKIIESHTYSLIGELVGDPLLHKAKFVGDLLRRDPVVEEYQRVDQAIKEDGKLMEAIDSLPQVKKDAALSIGSLNYEEKRNTLLKLEDMLNTHPMIKNRENLYSQIQDLIEELRGILS